MPRLMPYPRRGANSYLDGLYDALGRQGIEVVEDTRFFARTLRGQPPDFVHYHWPENHYAHHRAWRQVDRLAWFLVKLALQRAVGAQVIWTFHNRVGHEQAWPLLHRWARRRMVSMSDIILLNFEGARHELRLRYERTARVWHVPHGSYRGMYPDDVTREHARHALHLADADRVFLLFGDLRDYKNVDLAVEAFRRLHDGKARLLIAGQPRRPQEGARLAKLVQSDPRIHLHGFRIPDRDVQLYFRAADVLVIPREAFSSGTAVLAFDFGLPILAPRRHHIAELALGQACFDLTDLSVGTLTQALTFLLGHDLTQARLDAARCTAQMSWDGIAERFASRLRVELARPMLHAGR